MRKREKEACQVTSDDILEIYKRYGRRCFITGELLGKMNAPTLIRVSAESPLTKDNCVPAEKRVARALGFVLPLEYRGEFKKRAEETANNESDDDGCRRMLRTIELNSLN